VRFEVLTAVLLMNCVFWDVMCSNECIFSGQAVKKKDDHTNHRYNPCWSSFFQFRWCAIALVSSVPEHHNISTDYCCIHWRLLCSAVLLITLYLHMSLYWSCLAFFWELWILEGETLSCSKYQKLITQWHSVISQKNGSLNHNVVKTFELANHS
jgi:hypothetical protein